MQSCAKDAEFICAKSKPKKQIRALALMADNSNKAGRKPKGKETFVWTDDEAELLLRITLNYKTSKLNQNMTT